jgi:hypothetical protein
VENTHVQIELIEGDFDSIPWFVLFLCVDIMLMDVCFLSCICFDMLCM